MKCLSSWMLFISCLSSWMAFIVCLSTSILANMCLSFYVTLQNCLASYIPSNFALSVKMNASKKVSVKVNGPKFCQVATSRFWQVDGTPLKMVPWKTAEGYSVKWSSGWELLRDSALERIGPDRNARKGRIHKGNKQTNKWRHNTHSKKVK